MEGDEPDACSLTEDDATEKGMAKLPCSDEGINSDGCIASKIKTDKNLPPTGEDPLESRVDESDHRTIDSRGKRESESESSENPNHVAQKQMSKDLYNFEKEAMQIAARADFREMTSKYFRRYRIKERIGTCAREWVTECIEMDKPRLATFTRVPTTCVFVESLHNSSIRVGTGYKNLLRLKSGYSIKRAEERGITLRQLRAIQANIERRCVDERWVDSRGDMLTPKTVTFWDVNKYVTRPFTYKSKRSLVEDLPSTAGSQPPRWYVSHTWDGTFDEFLECLTKHIEDHSENENDDQERKGGGMNEDTPIWVRAFAMNHWDSTDDVSNVITSSFNAMKLADYRLMSIFDDRGTAFKDLWFIYELCLGLITPTSDGCQKKHHSLGKNTSFWCLYTVHDAKVSTIATGNEVILVDSNRNESASAKEDLFPMNIILESLNMKLEDAKTRLPFDREGILEFITTTYCSKESQVAAFSLNSPEAYESYSVVNDTLRASFAIVPGALQFAFARLANSSEVDSGKRNVDSDLDAMLIAMSKGSMSNEIKLNFHQRKQDQSKPAGLVHEEETRHFLGWNNLTSEQAVKIIRHLPLSIESLTISFAPFGYPFFNALAEWIKISNKIKVLKIEKSFAGSMACSGNVVSSHRSGCDAGIRIAEALSSNRTLEELILDETDLMGSRNVSAWAESLGVNRTLKKIYSKGMSSYADQVMYVGVSDMNVHNGTDSDSSVESDCQSNSSQSSSSKENNVGDNGDGDIVDTFDSSVSCPYDQRQKLYFVDCMLGRLGVKKLSQDIAISSNEVLGTIDLEDHMNFLSTDAERIEL